MWYQPSRSASFVASGCSKYPSMRYGLRRHTSPSSSFSQTAGCGRPTLPGFRRRSSWRSFVPGPPSVEPYHTRVIVVGERVTDRVDELGRRGRRAGVGGAERREVVARPVVLEHARPHGRDAVELGGAVALDGAQHAVGVGFRVVHGAVRAPCGERHAPSGHVEQREHAHHAGRGTGDRTGERAEVVGPVGEHHAFRASGAPAREEDDVRVALVEPGRVNRGGARAFGRSEQLGVRYHRRDGPLLGERRVDGVGDHEPRARIAHDGGGLARGRVGVDRREHCPELRQRAEYRHGFERSVAPPGDPVAVAHAHPAQRVRDAVRLDVELVEGEALFAERARDLVAGGGGRVADHVADQQRRWCPRAHPTVQSNFRAE